MSTYYTQKEAQQKICPIMTARAHPLNDFTHCVGTKCMLWVYKVMGAPSQGGCCGAIKID